MIRQRSVLLLVMVFSLSFIFIKPGYGQQSSTEERTYLESLNPGFLNSLATVLTTANKHEIKIYRKYDRIKLRDLKEVREKANNESSALCDAPKYRTLMKKKVRQESYDNRSLSFLKDSELWMVNNYNELDGIRHFIFSGILAGIYGYGVAKAFVTAHEQHKSLSAMSKMDIYNNELGLKEGAIHFESRKSIKELLELMKKRAVEHLEAGRLSVVRSGGDYSTSCTRKKLYPNKLHNKVRLDGLFLLKDGIPASCVLSRRSPCKKNQTTRGKAFCIYHKEAESVSKKCLRDLEKFFNYKADNESHEQVERLDTSSGSTSSK